MLVVRTHRQEVELLKWLLLLALAAILATLCSAKLAGAVEGNPREPSRLPAVIDQWANPIDRAEQAPADFVTPEHASHLVAQLREVIALHEATQTEAAQHVWQDMKLPAKSAVWRELGLALTQMQLTQLDHAAASLDRAARLDTNNPVTYYFRGILNLERAYAANEYYDAIGPSPMRLASFGAESTPTVRQTKSMYELMAMQDLEKAIELQGNVFMDETLLPSYLLPSDKLPPTVAELLRAWKSENFVGQSHNILGAMCLGKGLLERAEDHMDNATERGANVMNGYRELGARYESQDRHGDAMRAYAKAIQADPSVAPSQGMLRNMGRALSDLW